MYHQLIHKPVLVGNCPSLLNDKYSRRLSRFVDLLFAPPPIKFESVLLIHIFKRSALYVNDFNLTMKYQFYFVHVFLRHGLIIVIW